MELAKGGMGGVVVGGSGGQGAVRWEQGTCNASFRDEAQKLSHQKNPKANGKKVEFCFVHNSKLRLYIFISCIYFIQEIPSSSIFILHVKEVKANDEASCHSGEINSCFFIRFKYLE